MDRLRCDRPRLLNRLMVYGRPFSTFKPTDWAYDNFLDKVNDSRYYKTFQYEYISNMPASTSTSFTWSTATANWWNANKPAGEPTVVSGAKRILNGQRALIYLENQKNEALDSLAVMSQPYQFMVRWVRSATGKFYYRLTPVNGSSMNGLLLTARLFGSTCNNHVASPFLLPVPIYKQAKRLSMLLPGMSGVFISTFHLIKKYFAVTEATLDKSLKPKMVSGYIYSLLMATGLVRKSW